MAGVGRRGRTEFSSIGKHSSPLMDPTQRTGCVLLLLAHNQKNTYLFSSSGSVAVRRGGGGGEGGKEEQGERWCSWEEGDDQKDGASVSAETRKSLTALQTSQLDALMYDR